MKYEGCLHLFLLIFLQICWQIFVYLVTDGCTHQSKRCSLESKCSSPEEDEPKPLPPHLRKLKKSDSKKSFSGIISKIMKQNRTAKLWKDEAVATKLTFKKGKPKFVKTRSLPSDTKGFFDSRSISADQGYESTCSRDSSEDDDTASECSSCCVSDRRIIRRSFSAPGMGTHDLKLNRQRMACRHWQWLLRSSSSTWQSFNTHKTYCY